MTLRRTYSTLFIFLLFALSGVACQVAEEAPPPTLQAIQADTPDLAGLPLTSISVLQEQEHRTGQIVLYTWQDDNQNNCIGTTYLTSINNQWQAHDTLTAECQANGSFMAAYTGNSEIQAPFGPPRHTVIYGVTTEGERVRVVWNDGQVKQLPVVNGSFLYVRDDYWQVEQVELLDGDNTILHVEDWTAN